MASEEKRARDSQKAKEWRKNNPEEAKEKDRLYRERNADKIKITLRESRQRRKEKVAATSADWYAKNREYILALKLKQREENRDLWNEKAKEWQRNNPEKVRETRARSKAKNKDKIIEYRQQNKETFRVYAQNRRQRLRKQTGAISLNIAERLMNLQNSKCPVCKSSLKSGYHLDHIWPIAKGGAHDDSNIQLLCPSCNVKKSAKDPIAFMQQRGYLL